MTKKKKLILSFLTVLFAVLAIWTAWGNSALELNRFEVKSDRIPESFDGYRIAHISDLHNAEMGEKNEKLITLLREADPDIVVITGDLIDSRRTDIDVALDFTGEAVKIAPCFYVTGNHEGRVGEYAELKEGLMSIGVTVLEDEKVTLSKDGEEISLLGVNDPTFKTDYLFGDDEDVMNESLKSLMDGEENYTVLLSHRPELFMVYAENDVNLVFSGHAHGGQFRLPIIGGLIAPNQGLFPKYDSGMYTKGDTNMIVSRGIGNSIIPFRFNNRPEVIITELKSA